MVFWITSNRNFKDRNFEYHMLHLTIHFLARCTKAFRHSKNLNKIPNSLWQSKLLLWQFLQVVFFSLSHHIPLINCERKQEIRFYPCTIVKDSSCVCKLLTNLPLSLSNKINKMLLYCVDPLLRPWNKNKVWGIKKMNIVWNSQAVIACEAQDFQDLN